MRKCYCSDGFYSETSFTSGVASTITTVAKPTAFTEQEEEEVVEEFDQDEITETVDDEDEGLSAGVFIGIIFGCMGLLLVAILMVYFLYKRKRDYTDGESRPF